MDTVWLEDFMALAAHANFPRAAEARHVTQPAFSRRIRLLEEWLGVSLADRSTHQATVLTAMARNGADLTWAPMSLVAEDLAAGRLVRAGDSSWDVPMVIQLVRPGSRQSQAAEAFWAHLRAATQGEAENR